MIRVPGPEPFDPPVWPIDLLHAAMLVTLLGAVLFAPRPVGGAALWAIGDVLALGVLALGLRHAARHAVRRPLAARVVYGTVVVPMVFWQVGEVIPARAGRDLAAELERLDRALFLGTNPLEAVESLSTPLVNELLQWAYVSYFGVPFVAIAAVARRGRRLEARALFGIVASLYLCYAGFACVPASGPNVHDGFGATPPSHVVATSLYHFRTDLPGLFAASAIPRMMDFLEPSKLNSFPSGHVALTLVCAFHAVRARPAWRAWMVPWALAIVLSTATMRYHYVVDVLAGIGVAAVCVLVLDRAHRAVEARVAVRSRRRPAAHASGHAAGAEGASS